MNELSGLYREQLPTQDELIKGAHIGAAVTEHVFFTCDSKSVF